MVFLVYREGMQLPLVAMVLREASALMRISSSIYNYSYNFEMLVWGTYNYSYSSLASFPSSCIVYNYDTIIIQVYLLTSLLLHVHALINQCKLYIY